MPRKTKDQPPQNFEEAVSELESIIERIEAGEVGLEQSLEQYEHGMKLIRHCRAILERAEQQIVKLTREDPPLDDADPLAPADEPNPDADA